MTMKSRIITTLALAAACAFGAPIPSYRVATNIAETVAQNIVTSTVTKAYVENLGVNTDGGVVNATNVINSVDVSSTRAKFVNVSGDGDSKTNEILTVNSATTTKAGLMSAQDKGNLDNASATIVAWDAFLYGSNVVFSITNYQSGAYSTQYAKMRILELRNGQYAVIYDSREEILAHITNETARVRREINGDIGASNATFVAALDAKADRAWGKYTSSGEPVAETNTIYMTAPNTIFGGGYEFQRMSVNEGVIWVMTDRGAPAYTTGQEGVFKFQDLGGTNSFGFAKTDSFMLGCDTDGIRVYAGIIELTYHVTTPTCPIIRYSTELTVDAEWVALNNSAGEPNPDVPDVTVQWENNPPPGTMVAYISLPNRPSGFFTASIESVGGAKFFTNMEADLQGGITCTNTSLNTTGVIYPTFDGTSVQWNWRMR